MNKIILEKYYYLFQYFYGRSYQSMNRMINFSYLITFLGSEVYDSNPKKSDKILTTVDRRVEL
jgi:hypothetical protein